MIYEVRIHGRGGQGVVTAAELLAAAAFAEGWHAQAFTEVRYLAHQRQGRALEPIPRIAAGFAAAFGRESGGSTGLGGTGLELRRARREKARS